MEIPYYAVDIIFVESNKGSCVDCMYIQTTIFLRKIFMIPFGVRCECSTVQLVDEFSRSTRGSDKNQTEVQIVWMKNLTIFVLTTRVRSLN